MSVSIEVCSKSPQGSEWDACGQCDKCGALSDDLVEVGGKHHCLCCESAYHNPKLDSVSPLFAKILNGMGQDAPVNDVSAYEHGEFWAVASVVRDEALMASYSIGFMPIGANEQADEQAIMPRLFTARKEASSHLKSAILAAPHKKIELVRVQWCGAEAIPLRILFPSVENEMLLGLSPMNKAMLEV